MYRKRHFNVERRFGQNIDLAKLPEINLLKNHQVYRKTVYVNGKQKNSITTYGERNLLNGVCELSYAVNENLKKQFVTISLR